jgi:hypothetical protein
MGFCVMGGIKKRGGITQGGNQARKSFTQMRGLVLFSAGAGVRRWRQLHNCGDEFNFRDCKFQGSIHKFCEVLIL